MKINEAIKIMAEHQLQHMINRDHIHKDLALSEWRRRWNMDYPWIRSATGVQRYE